LPFLGIQFKGSISWQFYKKVVFNIECHEMKLDKEATRKVAKLANLPVGELDIDKYSHQLSAVLEYIDQLQKVNTEDIEPSYNVSEEKNITREDEVRSSLPQDEVLKNAPKKEQGYFVTKGVFNDE
jgi:aspartyl-tRNA(Asn)/glutamyl-tRNA(Gln) amidotransferase subunit C